MRLRTRSVSRAAAFSAVFVLVTRPGEVHGAASKEVSNHMNGPVLQDDIMGQVGASLLGESALVDKESGRVLWEGGTTTLSASLAPILDSGGLKHVRATILTGIFLLALIGSIVARIRQILFDDNADPRSWPMASLLFVADWTVLRFPRVHGNLLIASILLYLLESHTCSTRRYLANALSSPVEVEEYIERLRHEPPEVTWRVRCFHYERRRWLTLLSYLSVIVKFLTLKREEVDMDVGPSIVQPSSRLFTRKVVTHQAVSHYNYTSFEDKTVAGVWRRAEATAATPAPFSKIILSKLLILPTTKAREDYFKQQSTFVTREGRDEFTEFSTSIQVKGFRRRMLAVRPVEGVPSAKLFRLHMYWIFTLAGLTVPFRIWFARHCDELRVTVAKETIRGKASSSSWSSWFSRSDSKQSTERNRAFKSKMRELALYAKGNQVPLIESSNETVSVLENATDEDSVSDAILPAIATNETWSEISDLEKNVTETPTNGTKKEEKQPEPPPPPPAEDRVSKAGEATDREESPVLKEASGLRDSFPESSSNFNEQ